MEGEGAEDSHPVRQALVQHLRSGNTIRIQSALQLFDVMLSSRDEHAVTVRVRFKGRVRVRRGKG